MRSRNGGRRRLGRNRPSRFVDVAFLAGTAAAMAMASRLACVELVLRQEWAVGPGCHQKTDKQYQSFDFLRNRVLAGYALARTSQGLAALRDSDLPYLRYGPFPAPPTPTPLVRPP